MFYLCYVIENDIGSESMCDDYNHVIEKGMQYLKCNYLEKISEKMVIFLQKAGNNFLCFTCTCVVFFCVIEG